MKSVTAGIHRDTIDFTFRDNDGILFMLAGAGHCVHLVAALYQLRIAQEFKHRIAVVTTDDVARAIVTEISRDVRIPFEHIHKPLEKAGPSKGGHYANKTRMNTLTPFERTVFLDADTLVFDAEQLARMLPPNPAAPEIMLTQFSNWVTCEKPVRGRIEAWADIPGSDMLAAMLANRYPAINTGVFGFGRNSKKFFKAWVEFTYRNVSFMCDEIAAQLIFPKYPHQVRSHRYNASVVYSKFDDSDDGPFVWHGHGWKFAKKKRGREIWMPVFLKCVAQNFGYVKNWIEQVKKTKVMSCLNDGQYIEENETRWDEQFKQSISQQLN